MNEEAWREKVEARFVGITGDIHDVSKRLARVEVKNQIDEVHRQNVEKRLTNIEDVLKRLVWLILTGIIGGILTFIVTGGLNVG